MSNKKIGCGGFLIDNETLKEEDGVLKVAGGGSGGGDIFYITVGQGNVCNASYNDVITALEAGKFPMLVVPGKDSTSTATYYTFSYAMLGEESCTVLFEGGSQVCVATLDTAPLTYLE